MQIELSISELKTEVSVALANSNQSITQGCPELHVQLITLTSSRWHSDVGISVQAESGPALTPESITSRGTAAISPVVVFSDKPRGAGSAVQADDILTTGESHAAVLASESRLTITIIVGNAI